MPSIHDLQCEPRPWPAPSGGAGHQRVRARALAERLSPRRARAALLALLAFLAGVTCEEPQKITTPEPLPPLEGDIVQTLARAYTTRDLALFASLLVDDPATNAEFLFVFDPPADTGETQWGRVEEIRLHHRLLRPDSLLPGQEPVPPAAWVHSITATFTRLEDYQERPDLYSENGGPLPAARWRAVDARHATFFLFQCDETDFLVGGESNFVVLEDRTKPDDDPAKFRLYIWEEVCDVRRKPAPSGVTETCLSFVKAAYR